MANFSVSETQLSGPQGAGSQAVQAVQTPAPVTEGLMQTVSSAVDLFAKGLVSSRKAEAEATKNTVVNRYIKEITTINDALDSGMDPSKAKMHTQVIFNKYMASYGTQYGEDLEKAAKILRGQTQLEGAEDKIATEKKHREQRITQAQADGVPRHCRGFYSLLYRSVNSSSYLFNFSSCFVPYTFPRRRIIYFRLVPNCFCHCMHLQGIYIRL